MVLGGDLPDSDARSDWKCAYPYTESNCQTVLLAWADDHGLHWENIFSGSECSNCEATYYQDMYGYEHLIYAKCMNQFGASFTRENFLTPIKRYRESTGTTSGWNVVGWHFEKCFETWGCSEYCSLTNQPPQCLKYRSTNWGLYEPDVANVCSFGAAEPEPYAPTSQPPSDSSSGPLQRDDTWVPLY